RLIETGGELQANRTTIALHVIADDNAQRRDMRINHRPHLPAIEIAHGQEPAERAAEDRHERIAERLAIARELMRDIEDRRDGLAGELFRCGLPGRDQL